ncbi:class I SAM-dependent DNA methyltransferase [Sphingomonas parva]|uniref:class I SAM-dependent DNA methyltransferase n=1 Tax=Sphingomonas parva TaxID=2555898 RepID=UPI001CDBF30C|nr:class I SAM-dependent methyltransferase [Sphingomonas parva]
MRPSDRIPELYERHAEAWDEARRDSFVDRAWIDRFLAQVQPAGRVLDLGCGSGRPIARHLIDAGLHVTGIDVAPRMVALCAERFPGHDWRVADMTELALGRRFDGILAWDSFFI